jgi:hypothetical protein
MALIIVGAIVLLFYSVRALRRQVLPLITKMDGMLDNLTAITITARDQVDDLKTVLDDLSYSARSMAQDMQSRVISPIVDAAAAIAGIARFLNAIFGRGKKL